MANSSTVRAVVRGIEDEGRNVIVEVEQGGCGRCHEKGGCGGQHLTQMFCSGPKTYCVRNPGGLAVGERVTVAIASGAVRRTANLAYGLPLLGILVGALVGMGAAGDPGAIVGGLGGLILAWVLVRMKVRSLAVSGNPQDSPYIVSRSH